MNFYSIRDLRTDAKSLWQTINDGDEAIITNNGKPAAVMVSIPEGYFDESIQAIRQASSLIESDYVSHWSYVSTSLSC